MKRGNELKTILYTSGCPRCKTLAKKLDEANIVYEKFSNVDEMINMGITTVPMLRVDDTMMNFSEAIKWINEGVE